MSKLTRYGSIYGFYCYFMYFDVETYQVLEHIWILLLFHVFRCRNLPGMGAYMDFTVISCISMSKLTRYWSIYGFYCYFMYFDVETYQVWEHIWILLLFHVFR